eukprot:6765584-Prymnesium_polylepis.1
MVSSPVVLVTGMYRGPSQRPLVVDVNHLEWSSRGGYMYGHHRRLDHGTGSGGTAHGTRVGEPGAVLLDAIPVEVAADLLIQWLVAAMGGEVETSQ